MAEVNSGSRTIHVSPIDGVHESKREPPVGAFSLFTRGVFQKHAIAKLMNITGIILLIVTVAIVYISYRNVYFITRDVDPEMLSAVVGQNATPQERAAAYVEISTGLKSARSAAVTNLLTVVLIPMFNLLGGAILGYLFGRKQEADD